MDRLGWRCAVVAVTLLIPAGTRAQEATPDPVDTTESTAPADAEESAWWLGLFGYIRVAYEQVDKDPNFDFVGRNSGFVLHNARLGVAGGNEDWELSWRVSIDGAADLRENLNIPQGRLEVRLRDAFFREDALRWVGVQVGQFKAPFSAEEMRSTASELFVSGPVGLEGVHVGRGLEEPGIVVGRQLGAMLSPREPLYFGDFGLSYYLALVNGNGDNQILNDNRQPAYVARLELYWCDLVRLGGSFLLNERTIGAQPNRFDEDDFGYSADLLVTWEGLEVFAQLTGVTTEYPTTGVPDRERLAYHAEVSYVFEQLPVPLGPAYRYAVYHPHAEGGVADGIDLDTLQLTYHTVGLIVRSRRWPLTAIFNATLTGEEAPRELDNNRYEFLTQVVF